MAKGRIEEQKFRRNWTENSVGKLKAESSGQEGLRRIFILEDGALGQGEVEVEKRESWEGGGQKS